VVLAEGCPPPEDFSGDKPKYSVELVFLASNGRVDCAIAVRVFSTRQLRHVSRHVVARLDAADSGPGSDGTGVEAGTLLAAPARDR
jgi:hypothetical protein